MLIFLKLVYRFLYFLNLTSENDGVSGGAVLLARGPGRGLVSQIMSIFAIFFSVLRSSDPPPPLHYGMAYINAIGS